MKSIANPVNANSLDQKRFAEIVYLFKNQYPNARIVLKFKNPWELLVAVILSAQCTDAVVNRVTEKLFSKYRSINDYEKADIHEFEKDIKSTGFYHNKAKNIQTCAKLIIEKFDGSVPGTMDELLRLPGVARKTANIILGNIFNKYEGIAVDTHVHRISQRLRIVPLERIGGKREVTFSKNGKLIVDYKKDADANKIEQELMKVILKEDWFKITYLFIDHGRAICKAKNPDCSHCFLRTLCPVTRV